MNYFISDLHFGHGNIVKLCGRPFDSVAQMDNAMIENWNSVVKNGDTVYIVGDFAYKTSEIESYLKVLKGKKVLITGNHDSALLANKDLYKYFESIVPYLEIHLEEKTITMCHYPMIEWKNSRKVGSKKLGYLIYGHIHNNIEPSYERLFSLPNALNAGVDINNFTPVTFQQLIDNNMFYRDLESKKMNRKINLIHKMKLNDEPFTLISDGKKTIEIRLNDEKRKQIQVGDSIVFNHVDNAQKLLRAKVVALHKFEKFEDMYAKFPRSKFGFADNTTIEELLNMTYSIYTKNQEKSLGVLAIEIKL